MQIFTKDGHYFIGREQVEGATVFEGVPQGPVYYLYSDEKSKQSIHYIHDLAFITEGQESLQGFLNPSQEANRSFDLIGVNTFHGPFKALRPIKKNSKSMFWV